jgi:uncharacterized protein (UPF0264 family)
MQLLVSVRSVDEALLAARHGADYIDCKEPRAGALGGLPPATISEIVRALCDAGLPQPVSATIGDGPMPRAQMLDRVAEVAACGVDLVKAGIEPREAGAREALGALAACGAAVVPVFIADRGIDFTLVDCATTLGFAALMADTADKRAGSLFDAVPMADLQRFVQLARSAGVRVGVAGALRVTHVPALRELAPDFAGFRSAVCAAGREGALEAALVGALRDALGTHLLSSGAQGRAGCQPLQPGSGKGHPRAGS